MTTPLTQLDELLPQIQSIDQMSIRGVAASMKFLQDHGPALRAALADAERMDFIIANLRQISWSASTLPLELFVGESAKFHGDTFRAAIDRAIAASKEGSDV